MTMNYFSTLLSDTTAKVPVEFAKGKSCPEVLFVDYLCFIVLRCPIDCSTSVFHKILHYITLLLQ